MLARVRRFGRYGRYRFLHFCQSGGLSQSRGQFGRQFALGFDGLGYFLPPLLQPAQIVEPFCQGADGLVIHRAVLLLAVTGNKGDGIALIQ